MTVYGYRPSAAPGCSSHLLVDVSVAGSCTQAAVRSASYSSHMRAAERRVARDYRRVAPPHRFVPAVTDGFGGMSPAARRLFRECTTRRADTLRRAERDLSTFSCRSHALYYQQLHAVTFWRFVADAFIRHCADRSYGADRQAR